MLKKGDNMERFFDTRLDGTVKKAKVKIDEVIDQIEHINDLKMVSPHDGDSYKEIQDALEVLKDRLDSITREVKNEY